MTTGRRPSEDELRAEAEEILFHLWSEFEHETEVGRLPGNLAAFAEGRVGFLALAREHDVPNDALVEAARGIAALHARMLDVLRDRERELAPDR